MDDPNAVARGFFAKMMNFDTMIGPTLIKVMYFIGLVLCALAGVAVLLSGLSLMTFSPAMGLLYIIFAPIIIVIYAIFWRFACELWMLMFKIYDRLGEIKNKLPG
jgi:hypothetical protein